MTENQQRIIDSLIDEFNTRNEAKKKSSFKLINVDEFDEIHNLHQQLLEDYKRTKELWDSQRNEFILDLMDKLRDDLGDRLVVNRGDIAMVNSNYSNSIFIYKHGTEKHMMLERAFQFEMRLVNKNVWNDTTKYNYDEYINFEIKRYVSGSYQMTYRNEDHLFSCDYTKRKLKELLN